MKNTKSSEKLPVVFRALLVIAVLAVSGLCIVPVAADDNTDTNSYIGTLSLNLTNGEITDTGVNYTAYIEFTPVTDFKLNGFRIVIASNDSHVSFVDSNKTDWMLPRFDNLTCTNFCKSYGSNGNVYVTSGYLDTSYFIDPNITMITNITLPGNVTSKIGAFMIKVDTAITSEFVNLSFVPDHQQNSTKNKCYVTSEDFGGSYKLNVDIFGTPYVLSNLTANSVAILKPVTVGIETNETIFDGNMTVFSELEKAIANSSDRYYLNYTSADPDVIKFYNYSENVTPKYVVLKGNRTVEVTVNLTNKTNGGIIDSKKFNVTAQKIALGAYAFNYTANHTYLYGTNVSDQVEADIDAALLNHSIGAADVGEEAYQYGYVRNVSEINITYYSDPACTKQVNPVAGGRYYFNLSIAENEDYLEVSNLQIANNTFLIWVNSTILNMTVDGVFFTNRTEYYNATNLTAVSPLPFKSGYWFSGWNLSENMSIRLINSTGYIVPNVTGYTNATGAWINKTLPDGSELLLNAVFTANTTVLNLTVDGAAYTIRNETFNQTNSSIVSPLPEKEGFIFKGWNLSTDSTIRLINSTGHLLPNVTGYTNATGAWINSTLADGTVVLLVAQYTTNATILNLTFDGSQFTNRTEYYNQTNLTAVSPLPFKAGYMFDGWNLSTTVRLFNSTGHLIPGVFGYTNATGAWVNDTLPDGSILNLESCFIANTTILNLTVDNALFTKRAEVYNQTNLSIVSPLPVKEGRIFKGWNLSAIPTVQLINSTGHLIPNVTGYTNATGAWINSTVANGTVLLLVPQYTTNATILNLTFDGSQFTNRTEYYNQTNLTAVSPLPFISGYTFDGWNLSENMSVRLINGTGHLLRNVPGYTNATGAWVNDTLPDGSVLDLDSCFIANTTILNLTVDNAAFAKRAEVYNQTNSSIVSPLPTKSGYTFKGWNISSRPKVQLINDSGYLIADVLGYTNSTGAWINSSLPNNGILKLVPDFRPDTNTTILNLTVDGIHFANRTEVYNLTNRTAVSPLPFKSGYMFDGWNITARPDIRLINSTGHIIPNVSGYTNATGTWINNSMPDGFVLDLDSCFIANTTILNLTVGNVSFAKRVEVYNQTNLSIVSPLPTRDGYRFTGWNLSSVPSVQLINGTGHLLPSVSGYTNANGTWINSTVANGTVLDLVPQFMTNATILHLMVDGVSFTNRTEYCNQTNLTAVSPLPVKAGYMFAGWNLSDDQSIQLINSTGHLVPSVSGYTNVTGAWINNTLPDGYVLNLDALFTANMTILNLTFDGASFANRVEVYNQTNSSIVSPLPSKEGVIFMGWNLSSVPSVQLINSTGYLVHGVAGYTNVTGAWINSSVANGTVLLLVPQYRTNATTLHLMVDGVSFANRTEYYNQTNLTAVSPLPGKAGHTFTGWNLSSAPAVQLINGTGRLVHGVTGYTNATGAWINNTVPDGSVLDLESGFIANTTILNLTVDNAAFAKRVEVYNQTNLSIVSPLPKKDGATFNGWNLSSRPKVQLINSSGYLIPGVSGYTNSTGAWINSSLPNNGILKLVPDFTIDANITILNLTVGNVSFAKRVEVYNQTNLTAVSPLPEKDGYIFNGWNLSEDQSIQLINSTGHLVHGVLGYTNSTGAWVNETLPNGAELQLIVNWTLNTTYPITYHLNGGNNSPSNPSTYKNTSKEVTFENPVKSGAVFAGWYNESSFVTPVSCIPANSSGAVALYAKWDSYFAPNETVNTSSTWNAVTKANFKYTLVGVDNNSIEVPLITNKKSGKSLRMNDTIVIKRQVNHEMVTIDAANYSIDSNNHIVFNTSAGVQISDLLEIEFVGSPWGDADGDRTVTVNDAVRVAQSLVKIVTLKEKDAFYGDTDGDGSTTVNDAVKIAQRLVNLVDVNYDPY